MLNRKEEHNDVARIARGGVQGGRGGSTCGFECVGGRGGVQGGREGRTGDMGVLEVEVEFKEDEQVVLSVLEVEVEFKEGEKEERVIWGCWRSRWSSRRMNKWF